jgi:WD40 repeat protein
MAPRRVILPLLAALALMTAAPVARAQQQPSSEPVLRVEIGMHTALIKRAAIDAAGRLLATAFDDKTVRLWSLADGAPIRILRPPIGDGNEGKLYAVAMSPDGKFLVTGGWTGYAWEKANSLYVFETESGRLVRRVGGLPHVVLHLAWSPDGRFVAASLAGAGGVRVLSTNDWQETGSDTDYGDASYGLAFDRADRLAAVGYDGFVRLYDRQFRRIAKAKVPGGSRPYSAAFSPDGTQLAVGFSDSTAVDILAAADLKFLFAANTQGVANGDLARVAWASNGSLLAGGRYATGSDRVILRWDNGGRGNRQALLAAFNTVDSILPLADGSFVYASSDPASAAIMRTEGARSPAGPRPPIFEEAPSAFPPMARSSHSDWKNSASARCRFQSASVGSRRA